MKLILISSPVAVAKEAKLINELFTAGLEILHLRKPGAPKAVIEELLSQIEPAYYSRIALHQHHSLAPQFRINRLHFPEQERQSLTPADWEELQAAGFKMSTSVHQPEALKRLPQVLRYVFLSPVFTSISKPGYQGILDNKFYLAPEDKPFPVIALGGITPGNINQVKKMNLDGAAVLGFIWEHPEHALENYKALKLACTTVFPLNENCQMRHLL